MKHHQFVNYLDPVAKEDNRPLWSVVIPTYNCANFLREALTSVLIQDPGPATMEIIITDDGSTDDIDTAVSEVGGDRVIFLKQQHNVGHIQNFETGLHRTRGQLIHILHGDDRVCWGFYNKMQALFETNEIHAAYCRHYFIDEAGNQGYISPLIQKESGIMYDFFERMLKGNLVQTPSMVVKRSVYEQIGMFDHRFTCMEDYEMWTRIGKHFQVGYCRFPLAEYRNFLHSHTIRTVISGDSWKTLQLLNKVWLEYNDGLIPNLEHILINNMAEASWYDIRKLWSLNNPELAWDLYKKSMMLKVSLKQKLRLSKAYYLGLMKSLSND
ncbi:MAG: glycosyltransferase [Bacteroidia bacterium]|nr:MAG: glycosyltransferase [Bacteroidia bacterium]